MKGQSFCPAAWNSLSVNPSGDVENCCVSTNKIGNINQTTDIKQILFSEKNQRIQQDMIDGRTVGGCQWCHNTKHNLQTTMLSVFDDYQSREIYNAVGNFELGYLDLRWHNTCNLACVYCGPVYSSTWADELKQYHRIERDNRNNLMDYVLENITSLRKLYLAGGEPLMIKENEVLLRELLEKNPACSVLINTNLSQIKNNKIFELATQMPNCHWLVSVEAMGNMYEYIRYPGNWAQFNENLMFLKSTVGIKQVGFNMVAMNLNCFEIWETVDYLIDNGFDPATTVLALYNNGQVPGLFDMKNLAPELIRDTLKRMNKNIYKTLTGWQNIHDYLVNNQNSEYWSLGKRALARHLGQIDHRRNIDSTPVFPVLYNFINNESLT